MKKMIGPLIGALLFAALGIFAAITWPIWTLIVLVAILLFVGATYPIWLFGFLRELALHNIVVTNIEEGTGKLVMRNGKAWRFLTSDKSTDPKEEWRVPEPYDNVLTPTVPGGLKTEQKPFTGLGAWIDRYLLPGGMRLVGFKFMGYDLHKYHFRWEVERAGKPLKDEDGLVDMRQLPNGKWVATFAKTLDYIYLRDAVYYFEIKGAETLAQLSKADKDHADDEPEDTSSVGMSVDVQMLITIRVVNPYLALIFIHAWLESILDLLRPGIRSWISKQPYKSVIGKMEVAQREFDTFLSQTGVPEEFLRQLPEDKKPKELPKSFADYIECTYGVIAKRIAFDEVIPPEEYTLATTRRAEAEQERIRIRTLAIAEKQRLTIVGEGEAARIESVNKAIEEGGNTALEVRRLEAAENIGAHGNLIVTDGQGLDLLLNAKGRDQDGRDKGKENQSWQTSRGSKSGSSGSTGSPAKSS